MTGSEHQDRILRKLLDLAEPGDAAPASGDHPSEEALALFAAGDSTSEERAFVIQHLDGCPPCRRLAAELIRLSEESPPTATATLVQLDERQASAPRSPGWRIHPRLLMALAASLLLVLTLTAVYWPARLTEQTAYRSAKEQLVAGRFGDVRTTVATAERSGIASDRLRSLDAQAIRQIPDPLALAYAGRLADFGYDIGGVAARDPASLPHRAGLRQAGEELGTGETAEVELLLNRGHLHLSQNDLEAARQDFEAAVQLAPDNSLVWLGQGLVSFLQDDFASAEDAFRKAAEFDPQNVAVRINLAMTLQEQDKLDAAEAAWTALLAEELQPGERAKIEAVLKSLREPKP